MQITRQLLFGDMAIHDLSPKDANSSGRIIKNMRICGSGLYQYHVSEAPLMGLVIPEDYHGDTFYVFRSPEVLKANKDLYARVPIITGHHVRVNTSNAKQLAVGMVGDTVETEVGDDGETYLYTTGTIIAGDGIDAYEKYGELSVGYDPLVEWRPGTYRGKEYQAVLTGFNEINHLLICKTARGGHQCMIMDSIDDRVDINNDGGKAMDFFKKIFAKPAEKPIAGDAKVASAILQSVKAGADCKTQVNAVKEMLGDKVDETLKGYFEELTGDEVAKAPKDKIAQAIDVVDGYIQKLFGDEECKCDDKDCDDKPETGDKADDKSDDKSDDKKADDEPKSQAGDAIDYEKLATMVAEKLKPQIGGDEKTDEPKDEPQTGDAAEVSRLDALLNGDESTKDALTSDKLLKDIWG